MDLVALGIVIDQMAVAAVIGQAGVDFAIASGEQRGPVTVHAGEPGEDAVIDVNGMNRRGGGEQGAGEKQGQHQW